MIIRAYHQDRGESQRTKILVPDSAHGTNPTSTTMSGLEVVEIPSDGRGNVDLEARSDPETLKTAPHTTPFGRLDEVQAAKQLVLCCWPVDLEKT